MYAVTFEIDPDFLNDNYHGNNATNAYGDIRKFMESNNFQWVQGSVYFGNNKVDAVKCVLTVQRLSASFPWFSTCVKDIRMLRIEENTDLLPAIR